jgi:hypothetical protein
MEFREAGICCWWRRALGMRWIMRKNKNRVLHKTSSKTNEDQHIRKKKKDLKPGGHETDPQSDKGERGERGVKGK